MTDKQREALEKHQYKPGQSGNPAGINGWTKLRDRYRERLAVDSDKLIDVLVQLALDGDVQALRLALGPIVDIRSIELSGPDGAPIDFAGLAEMARKEGA